MSLIIPTGDGVTPHFDLQVTLEDTVYTLEFRWNVRLGAWFMSIYQEDGTTAILTGIRVVVNWSLAAYRGMIPLAGTLVAVDTSGAGVDPDFEELGDRVKLVYYSAEEIAAARAG